MPPGLACLDGLRQGLRPRRCQEPRRPATVLRKVDERRNELAAGWGAEQTRRKEWATAKWMLDERA
jgi:hypothetical protein